MQASISLLSCHCCPVTATVNASLLCIVQQLHTCQLLAASRNSLVGSNSRHAA
jgi:hypothetical protein